MVSELVRLLCCLGGEPQCTIFADEGSGFVNRIHAMQNREIEFAVLAKHPLALLALVIAMTPITWKRNRKRKVFQPLAQSRGTAFVLIIISGWLGGELVYVRGAAVNSRATNAFNSKITQRGKSAE
jgi:uncharacterized membrane protein